MTALSDLVLKVGHIHGLGMEDINGDSATPRQRPGTLGIIVDAFGPRILQYCKFINAMLMGELASRPANVSVANITSGGVDHAITTGLVAGAHDGKLVYVLDNADAAGAAPEGETSIVSRNTTTKISLERQYPLSVALANLDDLTLISNWQAEDAADGDLAVDVLGVVLGNAGVAAGNFGWLQREGFTQALLDTDAETAGAPVVADVNVLGDFGTDGQELWCGVALAAVTADQVAQRAPVSLKLFTCAGPGASP